MIIEQYSHGTVDSNKTTELEIVFSMYSIFTIKLAIMYIRVHSCIYTSCECCKRSLQIDCMFVSIQFCVCHYFPHMSCRFEKPAVRKSNNKRIDIVNIDLLETEE